MKPADFEKVWQRAKGEIRMMFGKLLEEDIPKIGNSFEKLVEAIHKRYGDAKDVAEEKVTHFLEKYREPAPEHPAPPRGPAAERGTTGAK